MTTRIFGTIKDSQNILTKRFNLGLATIVEPEVLIDGNHPLERCWEVTSALDK
ncbi:class I fructose-bisphosphate aldolase [Chamaesiphon sp.]|uniref:class I fructose-bisphosphate aldolase n=1 Tax=Chamaesiphon sp. TaxID=2814140 RepID=UPI00359377C2